MTPHKSLIAFQKHDYIYTYNTCCHLWPHSAIQCLVLRRSATRCLDQAWSGASTTLPETLTLKLSVSGASTTLPETLPLKLSVSRAGATLPETLAQAVSVLV